MRYDHSIVWNAYHVDNGSQYRELVDPHCSRHPAIGNIQLRENKPQPDGFAQHKNNGSSEIMNEQDAAEQFQERVLIALAQGGCNVSRCSSAQRARDKAQNGNHTAHDIVDAIIGDAQGV